MAWLDKIPFVPLIIISILLALAPFVPEPHLWEKIKMLGAGELTKPLDIFDFFFHSTPALLLLIKFVRHKGATIHS